MRNTECAHPPETGTGSGPNPLILKSFSHGVLRAIFGKALHTHVTSDSDGRKCQPVELTLCPTAVGLKLSTFLLLTHIIGHGGEGRRWHGSVLVQIEGQLRKEQ